MSASSTLTKFAKNVWRAGPRQAYRDLMGNSDTKYGTLVGVDKFGNKYFENKKEELPLRTKWVDYKEYDYDPSHTPPSWHAWLHYMNDKPPGVEPNLIHEPRPWEKLDSPINMTFTRAAYKPYSTTIPKIQEWEPVARSRN